MSDDGQALLRSRPSARQPWLTATEPKPVSDGVVVERQAVGPVVGERAAAAEARVGA